MIELPSDLQGAFLESMGKPIPLGAEKIVQGDRWELPGPAVVDVRFVKATVAASQSVRLSIKKPGKIALTDGTLVTAVAIYDDPALPRFARHRIDPKGASLLIYNSYTVFRAERQLEESWTGNAGMIVTTLSEISRRYECSDGTGDFDRTNLVFEVTCLPGDAPWLPEEIYA
jgi:hypothetical protein